MNLEFHFDFGSPNAYLSHLVIPAIEARIGITFDYQPVLIGGVFKATGNSSPAVTLHGIKNKGEYRAIETERFLRKHGITRFSPNPFFPVNTLQIMRGAVFAKSQEDTHKGFFKKYIDALYHHMWCEPKKLDETDVIQAALEESALPLADIMAAMQAPAVKQTLIDNTSRSVAMGAFGAPTFFVDTEIFFGKDKLGDLEEAIMRKKQEQATAKVAT